MFVPTFFHMSARNTQKNEYLRENVSGLLKGRGRIVIYKENGVSSRNATRTDCCVLSHIQRKFACTCASYTCMRISKDVALTQTTASECAAETTASDTQGMPYMLHDFALEH